MSTVTFDECSIAAAVSSKFIALANSSVVRHRTLTFKGWVQCFSVQVVINKCFLLNLEKKIGANSSCHFWQKRKNCTL